MNLQFQLDIVQNVTVSYRSVRYMLTSYFTWHSGMDPNRICSTNVSATLAPIVTRPQLQYHTKNYCPQAQNYFSKFPYQIDSEVSFKSKQTTKNFPGYIEKYIFRGICAHQVESKSQNLINHRVSHTKYILIQ